MRQSSAWPPTTCRCRLRPCWRTSSSRASSASSKPRGRSFAAGCEMAVDVLIPNAGQASGEATIIRWRKKAGDAVRQGEVLLEVETDKATMEVEATATGVLQAVRYTDGDVVPVLTVVAAIA